MQDSRGSERLKRREGYSGGHVETECMACVEPDLLGLITRLAIRSQHDSILEYPKDREHWSEILCIDTVKSSRIQGVRSLQRKS